MTASHSADDVLGLRRCAAPRCRRAAATRSRLCAGCRDEFAQRLRELPERCAALEVLRTPGFPLPAHAVEVRSAVRGVLASWAQVVVGGRAVPRPLRTVADLAGFLCGHVDWLGAHPAAADIVDEVGDLVARLRHADCAQCAAELAA